MPKYCRSLLQKMFEWLCIRPTQLHLDLFTYILYYVFCRYTGEGGTGMSVMEISVLSGYVPILDKKPPKPIKRWEMNEDEDKRVVAVYVDEVSR